MERELVVIKKMKRNVTIIGVFVLAVFALTAPQRAQAQVSGAQTPGLYTTDQKRAAKEVWSGIERGYNPSGSAASGAGTTSGLYEYRSVYIVGFSGYDGGNPAENGPVYGKKNGKDTRWYPALSKGPEAVLGNIKSIQTGSQQTVYILTWRDVHWYSLSSKTRLLIIKPNTEVEFNVVHNVTKKTGFILKKGTINEDKNIKSAAKLEEVMSTYSMVLEEDNYYGITKTVEAVRKTGKYKTKDELANAVIAEFAARSGALAALVGAGPIWLLPAEFAHSFVQNIIKAQLAYALSMVYEQKLKNADELKDDLYILFAGDDVQMTLKAFAKEAGVSVGTEVLSKQAVLAKLGSTKAFQAAITKAKLPEKVASKVTAKGLAKNIPIIAVAAGAVMSSAEATKFGVQAKKYYGAQAKQDEKKQEKKQEQKKQETKSNKKQ